MVDTQKVQEELLSGVIDILSEEFPGIIVSSEPGRFPQHFPFVSLMEVDSYTARGHIDSSGDERYVNVTYKADVFTDVKIGKNAQCRAIMNKIRSFMYSKNFYVEGMTIPTELESGDTYWMSARFGGCTDGDKFFRR